MECVILPVRHVVGRLAMARLVVALVRYIVVVVVVQQIIMFVAIMKPAMRRGCNIEYFLITAIHIHSAILVVIPKKLDKLPLLLYAHYVAGAGSPRDHGTFRLPDKCDKAVRQPGLGTTADVIPIGTPCNFASQIYELHDLQRFPVVGCERPFYVFLFTAWILPYFLHSSPVLCRIRGSVFAIFSGSTDFRVPLLTKLEETYGR